MDGSSFACQRASMDCTQRSVASSVPTTTSTIKTGVGIETENLQLQLAPSAVLSGKILDEFGDPIRQAVVSLWREDHTTGLSRIMRYREDVADDQGAYEFTPLDVGTYFLS